MTPMHHPRGPTDMKAQQSQVEKPKEPAAFALSQEQFDSVVAKLGSGPVCQQTHNEVERLVGCRNASAG